MCHSLVFYLYILSSSAIHSLELLVTLFTHHANNIMKIFMKVKLCEKNNVFSIDALFGVCMLNILHGVPFSVVFLFYGPSAFAFLTQLGVLL